MTAPDYPVQSPGSADLEDRVRHDADQIAETARRDLHDATDEVKKQAAALGDEVRHQARNAAESARNIAEEQKELLVEQVSGVSHALGKAADELEEEGQSGAGLARVIADSAERLTSTLRDNDLDGMLEKAQSFGRRQPVAFMGAAMLLGFAASRFVGASAARVSSREASAGSLDSTRSSSSIGSTPAVPAAPATSATPSSSSAVTRTEGGNDAGY